jgi:hypothetical protein
MRSSFIHLHLFGKPVAAHSASEDARDRAYDQVPGWLSPGRALLRFGPGGADAAASVLDRPSFAVV